MPMPAAAQKSADTLRITWRDADPGRGPLPQLSCAPASSWATMPGTRLVYRDPETFQIKPLIANAWKPVDETTLEFTLRHDITFQNGDKLSCRRRGLYRQVDPQ